MKNKIRVYSNTISINFAEAGDRFSLNVPHYKKWLALLSFLRRRGFKISENDTFKKHYTVLSKYHKIGYKKDIVCLLEISASTIKIEFGHIKNLWEDMKQAFWSNKSDERYAHLSYLEEKSVELEIKKCIYYFEKFGFEKDIDDSKLGPEEFIINKLKINKHIHGVVNCLDDIKQSIKLDSYDYNHNSNDANGKKIICGDLKYYYNYYTKRLCCGIAWHNINNMWWVIASGKLDNIACFNLFDFDASLPKRKHVDENKIDRLLKFYESKKDYKRCLNIKNYADRVLASVA